MGRSQRHKVLIQGTDSAGKGLSEKQPAIVYIRQNAASQTLTVPIGPTGGPLQGSSMAGFPPTLIPAPGVLAERDEELREGEGEWETPGQFNLSGNPIYTDLPPAGTAEELPPIEPPVEPEEPPVEPPTEPEEPPLAPDQSLPELETPSEAPLEARETIRDFPIGPFDLQQVTSDADKLRFLIAPDSPVRVGDEVLIEATNNTSVNSSYIVETVAYNDNGVVVSVDNVNGVNLASPIDGRGRLTITG